MAKRIINIDWLECFVSEPLYSARDAQYYREHGWVVKVRDHGTPQYREMFTVCNDKGSPIFEVRRNPYSVKSSDNPSGLFYPNDCHIRLSNYSCYNSNPIGLLEKILYSHHYTFKSISRIDVCCDFQIFDSGDDPNAFIRRYVAGRYRKMNQIQVYAYQHEVNLWKKQRIKELKREIAFLEATSSYETAYHGFDRKTCTPMGQEVQMEYNYISWHCPSSPIGTKLYNKSQEIGREGHKKEYIKNQWKGAYESGEFVNSKDVYRLEFSVRGVAKGWVSTSTGEHVRVDLDSIRDKKSLSKFFQVLVSKYFKFVYAERTKEGNLRSKSRSREKLLFKFSSEDEIWQNIPPVPKEHSTRKFNMLMSALKSMLNGELMPLTDSEITVTSFLLNKLRESYYTNSSIIPRIEEFKETEVYMTDKEAEQIDNHIRAINEIAGYDYGDAPEIHLTSEGDTRNPWKRAIDARNAMRARNARNAQQKFEESKEEYYKWQKYFRDFGEK